MEKKLLTVRLPEDLHYKFKLKVIAERKSIQEVIETFVKDYAGELDVDKTLKKIEEQIFPEEKK